MNVFILNTGRCGSYTFFKACNHITNYTSGHETRVKQLGRKRFAYPPQHIEVDNRLSWMLGRLDAHYGDTAFYVFLKRDSNKVAESFERRYNKGIIKSYRRQILMHVPRRMPRISVCADYCDTVCRNIELFLRDKHDYLIFELEKAHADFPVFWHRIKAEGDLQTALKTFSFTHNASKPKPLSRIARRILAPFSQLTAANIRDSG